MGIYTVEVLLKNIMFHIRYINGSTINKGWYYRSSESQFAFWYKPIILPKCIRFVDNLSHIYNKWLLGKGKGELIYAISNIKHFDIFGWTKLIFIQIFVIMLYSFHDCKIINYRSTIHFGNPDPVLKKKKRQSNVEVYEQVFTQLSIN